MNIRITSYGELHIQRGQDFLHQTCPFMPRVDAVLFYCGHWCPHFGEPEPTTDMNNETVWTLELCHGKVLAGQMEDQRERPA